LEQDISFDFAGELRNFTSSFSSIVQELKGQQKKMLITMHRFLDGDAFGSAVALGLILRRFNIESTLLCIPFVPDKFKFLGRMSKLHIVEPLGLGKKDVRGCFTQSLEDYFSKSINNYGALAILDCAGFGQIPEEAWLIGGRLPCKINIDHHFGYELHDHGGRVLNMVGNCSSTSEILYHFMKEIGIDVYPEIAAALYIGIIADLRKNEVPKDASSYPKGAIKTLNSQVKKMGIETQRKIKSIFSLDSWEKYLLKMVLAGTRFDENIVHVKFGPEMVFKAKEATDSLHNSRMPFHEFHIRLRQGLRRFRKDFQIVVIFDQILGKVSLYDLHKNDKYDLAGISRELGDGGGHINRAGFGFTAAKKKLMSTDIDGSDVSDDIIIEKIIEVIKRRIDEIAETSISLKDSEDSRETLAAFVEHRDPVFKGR